MDLGYHQASFRYPGRDEPTFELIAETARRVEEAGFSWYSVMDHLWQIPYVGQPDDEFYDAYSVLPYLAAETEEITLSTLVTCVHYRNPAVLGRIVTSLDRASQGRSVLAIGAGWFEEEYDGYDIDFPEASTRINQMEEAIRLIDAMWTEENPVSYSGEHYEIEDLVLSPEPVQEPRPPIMVGGGGEQMTMRVAAELADSWNIFGSPEVYGHKLSVLEGHCDDVGRDFGEIEKTVANVAVIRDSEEEAHEAYEELMSHRAAPVPGREEFRGAVGTPEDVAARIEEYRELGADLYIFRTPANDPETIDRFLDEVAPAV